MEEKYAIKKILVPTDFSNFSIRAMNYAASISETTGAELILFHVNETPAMMPSEPPVAIDYTFIIAEIKKELEKLKDTLSSYKLKSIRTEFKPGFTVDEIKSEAESENVDLIVMGTMGASGVSQFLTGSITASVIGKVKLPVLAVPATAPARPPSRVAFATNFNEKEVDQLAFMVNMIKPYSPEIFILHVEETGEEEVRSEIIEAYQKLIQEKINYPSFSFHMANSNSVEDAIQDFIRNHKIDWICTVMRKRSFFEKLVTRSLTQDIAFHSTIPLLAFHS